jgi:hypothetical protein
MDLSRVPRVRGDQLAPGPCPQGDPCRPDRPAPRQATTSGAVGRPPGIHGPESVELLRQCWAVLDGPTGKRLRPALPELLANLSAHGHLAETDSRAAIDRRLTGPHSTRLGGSPTGSID